MSTVKDIPINLANDVAEAFDGDNVHGARVRSLAAVLELVPAMTSRNMVRWVYETTGRRLSQSTVSRAQGVALALVTAGFPVADPHDDVTRTVSDLVRLRTLAGVDAVNALAEQWKSGTFTLETFSDVVNDAYSSCDAEKAANAASAAKSRESRKIPAVNGGVDGGSGSGQDMAGETVGGGETARITAGKESAALRALAGQITTGQVEVTDELITAARAVLTAIADRVELAAHVTAEPVAA